MWKAVVQVATFKISGVESKICTGKKTTGILPEKCDKFNHKILIFLRERNKRVVWIKTRMQEFCLYIDKIINNFKNAKNSPTSLALSLYFFSLISLSLYDLLAKPNIKDHKWKALIFSKSQISYIGGGARTLNFYISYSPYIEECSGFFVGALDYTYILYRKNFCCIYFIQYGKISCSCEFVIFFL